MMLLTKENKAALAAGLEATETPAVDREVAVKFFTPWSNWTWYAIEGEPTGETFKYVDIDRKVKEADDYLFFGLVSGIECELGYFVLSELMSVTGPLGMKVERDMGYAGIKLKDIKGDAGGKVAGWVAMMTAEPA